MPVGCFKRNTKDSHNNKSGNAKGHVSTDTAKTGVPEALAGTDAVTLVRKTDDDVLGIIFAGGVDKPSKPYITTLRTGGLAARSDCLQTGDYITVINGIHTEKLKHEELVTLMKNTGNLIHIQVAFPLPPRAPMSAFAVKCRKTSVSLAKDEDSVGLVIRGGANVVKNKSRPLTITYVRAGGAADRDGVIRTGDRIVAINRVAVITATVETARQLIKESGNVVHMVIEYDIAVMESVQNAEGPLLVEITRSVGNELGMSVCQQLIQGKPVIVIDTIYTGSIAERSGALHVGDHLLAINEMELNNMSVAEVEHFLSTGDSKVIQLEILPVGHLLTTRPIVTSRGRDSNPSSGGHSCQLNSSFYSVFSEDQHPRQASSAMSRRRHPPSTLASRRRPSLRSIASVSSIGGQSVLCHEETFTVSLFINHIGLGIILQSNTLPGGLLEVAPHIAALEPGSSAERSGVLQEGDRLVAINGAEVIGYTLDECKRLLDRTNGRCDLDIAFDVADGMLPSNATFQVKLLKRGGTTGISLEGRCLADKSHSIRICEVETASPAYRSGAIHANDELLCIDNLSLHGIHVEGARQILQNSGDVVKLKLRKAPKELSMDGELVFSVEIPKENNSVGLTITGKEVPNYPITISEIIAGGIAERVGALQVGDRLLTINGKPLKDQTVSFAIKQLQYGGDVISLTVAREKDKSGTGLQVEAQVNNDHHSGQSKDSALDSWDSQQTSPTSQTQVGNSSKGEGSIGENEKRDWSGVINELENFGKMEMSGFVCDVTERTPKSQHSAMLPLNARATTPSTRIPTPTSSLHTLYLSRESYDNFGFGLSNSMRGNKNGCYIKAIGKGCPADIAGLQKYDKLVQVNDIDVQNYSCNDIVPIIEVAGTELKLTVIRNTQETCSLSSGSYASSNDNVSYTH